MSQLPQELLDIVSQRAVQPTPPPQSPSPSSQIAHVSPVRLDVKQDPIGQLGVSIDLGFDKWIVRRGQDHRRYTDVFQDPEGRALAIVVGAVEEPGLRSGEEIVESAQGRVERNPIRLPGLAGAYTTVNLLSKPQHKSSLIQSVPSAMDRLGSTSNVHRGIDGHDAIRTPAILLGSQEECSVAAQRKPDHEVQELG
jgi:hypothetical protein